jgi:hypothetical protein
LGLKGAQAALQVSGQIVELNSIPPLILPGLIAVEVGGIRRVAVKCIDMTKNPDCVGS